jgi:RimJ/RimL family protein N-acetyltransferase
MIKMKLKTKRLILREWSKKDTDDLVEGLNNLKISRWLAPVPYPYTKKDAIEWINNCINESKKRKDRNYHFAIELKNEKKVIGGIGTYEINKFNGLAHIGFWINEKYHKEGYGTEALDAELKFIFNRLKLRRIETGFLRGNIRSLNLQKKFGFKIEGVRRKRFKCMADGKLKDEFISGLLREDWKIYDNDFHRSRNRRRPYLGS